MSKKLYNERVCSELRTLTFPNNIAPIEDSLENIK